MPKCPRSQQRLRAQRQFGSDTVLFDDLALKDWFCFAGEDCTNVYQKIRKSRYRHAGMLCYIKRDQPVKRCPAPNETLNKLHNQRDATPLKKG